MEGGNKKRRDSNLPTDVNATKKVRQTSDGVESHTRDDRPSMATRKMCFDCQKIFSSMYQLSKHRLNDECLGTSKEQIISHEETDPYRPRKQNQKETSLPSKDDWAFRVKVLSSTDNLSNDVFTQAVQGLVKICFPHGVLEELGVDTLEQHMRKQKAPKESIKRMREVFGNEMIHRITWMLAEHLDTPAKVHTAVESVISASRHLHSNLGEDLERNVINNIGLRGTDYEEIIVDVAEDEEIDQDTEPSQRANLIVGTGESIQGPSAQQSHNKKVSASARWNIEPDGLSPETVATAFKRTSDLFAFHALPIAKDALHANSSRKMVREKIQAMLNEMPCLEWDKWVESFHKLRHGDRDMLKRRSGDYRLSAATPAPIDTQSQATGQAPQSTSTKTGEDVRTGIERERNRHESFLKKEVGTSPASHERPREGQHQRDGPVHYGRGSRMSMSSRERQYGSSHVDGHRVNRSGRYGHSHMQRYGPSYKNRYGESSNGGAHTNMSL